MQLLGPRIRLLRLLSSGSKNPHHLMTAEDFIQEQGFASPALWVDYLALCGDAADNVPGVKGIGQKTAQQLVQEMGSLEDILQNVESASVSSGAEKGGTCGDYGQIWASGNREGGIETTRWLEGKDGTGMGGQEGEGVK